MVRRGGGIINNMHEIEVLIDVYDDSYLHMHQIAEFHGLHFGHACSKALIFAHSSHVNGTASALDRICWRSLLGPFTVTFQPTCKASPALMMWLESTRCLGIELEMRSFGSHPRSQSERYSFTFFCKHIVRSPRQSTTKFFGEFANAHWVSGHRMLLFSTEILTKNAGFTTQFFRMFQRDHWPISNCSVVYHIL